MQSDRKNIGTKTRPRLVTIHGWSPSTGSAGRRRRLARIVKTKCTVRAGAAGGNGITVWRAHCLRRGDGERSEARGEGRRRFSRRRPPRRSVGAARIPPSRGEMLALFGTIHVDMIICAATQSLAPNTSPTARACE